MRPTKDPEASPVYEEIVRRRLEKTKKAISETADRLPLIKKTVDKAQDVMERSSRLKHG